ncbi:hypothetical protein Pcinc_014324 [Petrolisthes cinctipes]|uniref:PiggyBac transposable element-derived protein 4 C-terminal zinc-finger domain-containing protein n=1 Tax=Petrolisthes cinctipes TaxID=88211 RepID=A0AAE1KRX0_PETCI|nr:hypothetical protein Pcinc_014324 [Petrolisthes cinctipes]
MFDEQQPSTSTGRRDFRGRPTVPSTVFQPATPTTTTTRPVKRRLDTSADIRRALTELDDYVSSDEDNLDGVDFQNTQNLPSSDSEAFDLDDDDESSDSDDPEPVAPAPHPRQGRRAAQDVMGPPQAASTPRRRGHRPVPPPTGIPDPARFRWTEASEDDPYIPNTYVFDDSDSGVGQAVRDLPPGAKAMDFFMLFFDVVLMEFIVEQTNLFFEYSGGHTGCSPFSPAKRWVNTTVREIFVEDTVFQLLENFGEVTRLSRGRGASMAHTPDRLHGKDYLGRHYLDYIPPTAAQAAAGRGNTTRHGQRRCKVCHNSKQRPHTRKYTNMMCAECQVPLCLPCFRQYHTLTEY